MIATSAAVSTSNVKNMADMDRADLSLGMLEFNCICGQAWRVPLAELPDPGAHKPGLVFPCECEAWNILTRELGLIQSSYMDGRSTTPRWKTLFMVLGGLLVGFLPYFLS